MLTIGGATLGAVAAVAAVAAFEVAPRLGRERTMRRLGHRGARADAWVQARGVRGVVALRLLRVVPFNALNYAFGLSTVGRRDHLIGTVVGIAPTSIAFVALGASVTDPRSPAFGLSLAWLAALIAIPAWRARTRREPPAAVLGAS